MPPYKVKSALLTFQRELDYSRKLVNLAQDVHQAYRPQRGSKLSATEVEHITELAFLKIFVAYEHFIETVFLKYMVGGESRTGYKPRRYVFPKDEKHAKTMILQDYSAFADWSTPSKVKIRANYCFRNGEPFSQNISAIEQKLGDMKTIRNAITHSSQEAKEKFEIVARRFLTTLPPIRNFTVGRFLLSQNPNVNQPQKIIDIFIDELKNFSEQIVP